MAQKMINEQMVTRNGQKGFLDDKGNFYPIADMPTDDAKVHHPILLISLVDWEHQMFNHELVLMRTGTVLVVAV